MYSRSGNGRSYTTHPADKHMSNIDTALEGKVNGLGLNIGSMPSGMADHGAPLSLRNLHPHDDVGSFYAPSLFHKGASGDPDSPGFVAYAHGRFAPRRARVQYQQCEVRGDSVIYSRPNHQRYVGPLSRVYREYENFLDTCAGHSAQRLRCSNGGGCCHLSTQRRHMCRLAGGTRDGTIHRPDI